MTTDRKSNQEKSKKADRNTDPAEQDTGLDADQEAPKTYEELEAEAVAAQEKAAREANGEVVDDDHDPV